MPRGGGAVVADPSETYGVSLVIELRELCKPSSTDGELVLVASAAGVSAAARLDELRETGSLGGELFVFASAAGISAATKRDGLCESVSTGGGLVVVALAVSGVGDVPDDGLSGRYVTPRITMRSTTPVNSAIVPRESCFAREDCAGGGGGGGTTASRGGAPHEGQAVANELISLPQS